METFRYAAEAGAQGELTCATCNPSGAPPAAEFAWSAIPEPSFNSGGDGTQNRAGQVDNAVSSSGQVFFETMEELLPGDENGTWDVYEYSGGEGVTAEDHLISSGREERPSFLLGATADGSNVFFFTNQALVRSDTKSDYDIYDARIEGGFSEPLSAPPCESPETCHGAGNPQPNLQTAASGNFSGLEEGRRHPRCQKGYVLRKGACAKKHGSRRHRHRHRGHRARNHRRAGR
jgi:hypothetical protein